jgi:adenine deaminase
MEVVCDDTITALPLDCGGLMSTLPYEDVCERLNALNREAEKMGGISNPFMYLSFFALTVIPELRLTNRGVFDVLAFADVPLFEDGL